MRHLLNTLFVLSEDIYLSLENENIIAWKEKKVAQKIPLLNLENILYFGYKGASPTLLGECAKRKIGFCFLNQNGKFLARVCGASYGNVFLRKEQYRLSDDERQSCEFAKYMLIGKIYNSRTTLMRTLRDHPMSVNQERKRETVTHPFLGEKILWGLIPYVQALLLAKFIRKDLDGYPAFLGK